MQSYAIWSSNGHYSMHQQVPVVFLLSLFILNRPPVFANYLENYMVVKEVMKEMFSVIFGPKNILGSQF